MSAKFFEHFWERQRKVPLARMAREVLENAAAEMRKQPFSPSKLKLS
jgi:hypothetical protein